LSFASCCCCWLLLFTRTPAPRLTKGG
jgi:hypothetical protein